MTKIHPFPVARVDCLFRFSLIYLTFCLSTHRKERGFVGNYPFPDLVEKCWSVEGHEGILILNCFVFSVKFFGKELRELFDCLIFYIC